MPNRHILVIDDDDLVREIIQSCFEDIAGWQVTAVDSGRAGFDRIQFAAFDAIILDVMMPEMDGIEFLKRLRVIPVSSAIPVILLTATHGKIQLEELARLHVEQVIAKPFDPITLVKQVGQCLERISQGQIS